MQHLKTVVTKKILLSLAAVSVISVGALGGTYANFTATPVTVSSNAFASGTLTMSRSGSGAIFSAPAVKIGEEATGAVTITNSGSLAGSYTLAGSAAGSLASSLKLVIYKDNDGVAGAKIFDGTLGGFSSVGLGTFAASGDAHAFYFHVSLPTTGTDAGDNALQGQSATASFTWSAVQA